MSPSKERQGNSSEGNILFRLIEYSYFIQEYIIMKYLVPKTGPGPIFKWLFKTPIWYYRFGLGSLVAGQILLLTTRGRKTGQSRVTPLGYRYDEAEAIYYVTSGWDGRTDWYRNMCADPHVHVQVGSIEFDCVAEPVSVDKSMELLVEHAHRNPFSTRVWSRWTGEEFDGSEEALRKAAKCFPSMLLRSPLLARK